MEDNNNVVELIFYTIHDGVVRPVAVYKVEKDIGDKVLSIFSAYMEHEIFTITKDSSSIVQELKCSPIFNFVTADGKRNVVVDVRWFGLIEMSIPAPKGGEVKAKGDNKLKIKKEENNGGN